MEEAAKIMIGDTPIDEIMDAFEKINRAVETLSENLDKEFVKDGKPDDITRDNVVFIELISTKMMYEVSGLVNKLISVSAEAKNKDQRSETPAPATRTGVAS